MNNEPRAWMLLRDESCIELTEWFGVMRGWEDFLGNNEKIVELYTHPVDAVNTSQKCVDKTQNNRHELTDEEINEIFSKTWLDFQDYKEFARAILRKAQEK